MRAVVATGSFRAGVLVGADRWIDKKIQTNVDKCIVETNLFETKPNRGKVRDIYELDRNRLAIVTTDRQSAFNRSIADIPFKGQVLNQTSLWWFEQTKHIVDNAVLSTPHPNVSVMRKLEPVPIEFIVRGYMTGSTDTSLWTHYKNGSREYCGNVLEEGMVKNQRLPRNILTPTTKGVVDEPISGQEVVARGILTEGEWEYLSRMSLELFEFGQREVAKRGLILVDTKYEFGRDETGNFYVIDELHTPDSSRYWISDTYQTRFDTGQEPENIDKEFLRLWFEGRANPYKDVFLPKPPEELVCELSKRYIYLYERLTGTLFVPTEAPSDYELESYIE